MLRAGVVGRERLPHSYGSEVSDDDETASLNDSPKATQSRGHLHRRHSSYKDKDEFPYNPYARRSSLITRIVTKPCRSIRTFLVLLAFCTLAAWTLHRKVINPDLEPTTMIYHEDDVRRVMEWEIQSGHWMSWRPISRWFHPPRNPSLPSPESGDDVDHPGGVIGCGWKRTYVHVDDILSASNKTRHPSPYPPRPLPGSIPDFDIVSQYCSGEDSSNTLRDCLLFLSTGSALSQPRLHSFPPTSVLEASPPQPHWYIAPVTRAYTKNIRNAPKARLSLPGKHFSNVLSTKLPSDWRYSYHEDRMSLRAPSSDWSRYAGGRSLEPPLSLKRPRAPHGAYPAYTIREGTMPPQAELQNPNDAEDEERGSVEAFKLDANFKWTAGMCEERWPRIVHMTVQGLLGDRAYMTILSFLYTQNLRLHDDKTSTATAEKDRIPCPSKIWVWLRESDGDWEKRLHSNDWSRPFVEDPRFKDLIVFKRLDVTELMDSTPELSADWRDAASLDLGTPTTPAVSKGREEHHGRKKETRDLTKRSRYQSPDAAEKLHADLGISVSDTIKWLLPHRYGGVYVEPGMLFLRDWEELWSYRGAFSTRAAPPSSDSNKRRALTTAGEGLTQAAAAGALLKLNKRSALGTAVLRTAMRHGLRLDPQSVQTYVDDAGLEEMLFPLPEMLEDLAGWSALPEQKERPASPSLSSPDEFFRVRGDALPPSSLGIAGFFRGAWFFHTSSSTCVSPSEFAGDPFDTYAREFPFDIARNRADIEKVQSSSRGVFGPPDQWDLPWSAIFKRTLEAYLKGEVPNMYGEWLKD